MQDANFNVTATADATGKVVDRYQYDAYGAITTLNADFTADYDNDGDAYVAYYFQGLRYDGNSSHLHARNRDYDPALGRWTNVDPLGYPDGMNRYAFVGSSPVGSVDPSGLQPPQCVR